MDYYYPERDIFGLGQRILSLGVAAKKMFVCTCSQFFLSKKLLKDFQSFSPEKSSFKFQVNARFCSAGETRLSFGVSVVWPKTKQQLPYLVPLSVSEPLTRQ